MIIVLEGNVDLFGVNHTDTTMCGSLNFQELHQGYLSVIRLLRAFNNFIRHGYAWCVEGVVFFSEIDIGV
jgi:hypothetical protein